VPCRLASGPQLGFGLGEPHELHAVELADGDEARLLRGLDGAIERLATGVGFLFLVTVRRVLPIELPPHELKIARSSDRPRRVGRRDRGRRGLS